ncbi:MAG TPA: hypothetical protein VFB90_06865 [Dehalococcoidia bacterium]|nr:hypothetical protein [Dehalococcoidia bacterium]
MSARALLLAAALLLALTWAVSGGGWLRRSSEMVQIVVGVLFVVFAVRLGLSIAIIAFGLSPASWLIPVAFGIGAWLIRPGRQSRKQP